MKKVIALTFSVLFMLFTFVGCGSDNKNTEIELSKILADVNDNGGLSSMKTITNATDLQKQFDIDPESVSDFIAEVSDGGEFPTTVAVIKANDEDALQSINDKLKTYLDDKLNNAQSYNQEQVATIKECSVQENGLYSMLVIAENHSDIEKIITGYFN